VLLAYLHNNTNAVSGLSMRVVQHVLLSLMFVRETQRKLVSKKSPICMTTL
jgi:hypothetical protein